MTDLFCRRGDSFDKTLGFTTSTDLTGCIVWMTIKRAKDRNALDSAAIAQIRSDGASPGVTIVDATHARFRFPPEVTALFPPGGDHIFDVQVKEPSGRITSPDGGTFAVGSDVTRATA